MLIQYAKHEVLNFVVGVGSHKTQADAGGSTDLEH